MCRHWGGVPKIPKSQMFFSIFAEFDKKPVFHISASDVHNYLHNVNNSAIYVHHFEYTPKYILNVLLTFIDTKWFSKRSKK